MLAEQFAIEECRLTVDTTHLVHELRTISQKNPTTGLHLIALEKLRPLVFTGLFLNLQRFEDFAVLLGDLFILWCAVVHIAENLESLFVATVFVEVAGRFGQAEDKDDDDL